MTQISGRAYLWGALAALVCAAASSPAGATSRSWHVSPTGTPAGDGSRTRPWDLGTGLAGGMGSVRAGDTVWLEDGRYAGSFATSLAGEPGRPIVFRQARGAHALIDGTLRADGAYLEFRDFEIEQSQPVIANTYGLQARTRGGKFIDLVVHDAGSMGVSFWSPAEDAELYGCIIYNNGTHDNLDHGVYVHNERGHKLLADNVIFDNSSYGIHFYAKAGNEPQQNVRIEGNILFNNGTISRRYRAKGNIIAGGDVPFSNIEVVDNLAYYSGTEGENLRLGYSPAAANGAGLARGNILIGGETSLRHEAWPAARLEANVVTPPNTTLVFVRPNRYETGRAFIAIVNPRRLPFVKVSLAGITPSGRRYEIRNVQALGGPPVASGVAEDDSVSIPMSGVNPPVPLGRTTPLPPRTGPAFDVFLVTTPQ